MQNIISINKYIGLQTFIVKVKLVKLPWHKRILCKNALLMFQCSLIIVHCNNKVESTAKFKHHHEKFARILCMNVGSN